MTRNMTVEEVTKLLRDQPEGTFFTYCPDSKSSTDFPMLMIKISDTWRFVEITASRRTPFPSSMLAKGLADTPRSRWSLS